MGNNTEIKISTTTGPQNNVGRSEVENDNWSSVTGPIYSEPVGVSFNMVQDDEV